MTDLNIQMRSANGESWDNLYPKTKLDLVDGLPEALSAQAAQLADIMTNVNNFGADPSGVNDSTTAIQAAIDAAPAGSTVYLPGKYLISGSGTELLLITKPLRFIGNGMYSQLIIAASVPNTTDVIRISPSLTDYKELSSIEGIQIIPESGTPARHGIHFDVSNPGQYISKFTVANCYIRQLGGHGLRLTNPTNIDGFFTSVIRDNLIYGGTYWQRIGDSVYFERNTITGSNVGIEMSAVAGAVQVIIRENNITTAGGAIRVDSGSQVKILNNQLEQVVAYTGAVDAMVYIGNPQMPEIIGNNLNARGLVSHCIRINGSYQATIDRNILRSGSAECIRVDDGATKTFIKYSNMYINVSESEIDPSILDNGNGTTGVIKTLTPSNSWTNVGGAFSNFAVRKDPNGMVHLSGQLSGGTTTVGTNILSTSPIPTGFRPRFTLRLTVGTWKPGSPAVAGVGVLVLATTGSLTIETLDAAVTRLDFDGISFQATP